MCHDTPKATAARSRRIQVAWATNVAEIATEPQMIASVPAFHVQGRPRPSS